MQIKGEKIGKGRRYFQTQDGPSEQMKLSNTEKQCHMDTFPKRNKKVQFGILNEVLLP